MNIRLKRQLIAWLGEEAVNRFALDNPDFLLNRRAPRSLIDIYIDLGTLNTTQQAAVWTNLNSGNPPKWALNEGDNAGNMMVLEWAVSNSGASVANINNAKRRLAALYIQDNVNYLVLPTFDPSLTGVNIPGDEAAT